MCRLTGTALNAEALDPGCHSTCFDPRAVVPPLARQDVRDLVLRVRVAFFLAQQPG